jgi:transmembrane sensor
MEKDRLAHLVQKSVEGMISDEEHAEMMALMDDPEYEVVVKQLLMDAFERPKPLDDIGADVRSQILQAVFQSDKAPEIRKPFIQPQQIRWAMGLAAAIALMVFGLFFFKYQSKDAVPRAQELAGDVAPGTYGATLTLASGKKIRLTEASNGELAKEAGILVSKSADGKLVYAIEGNVAEGNAQHTFSTAKGETYEVRLPDGSSVHLNAVSSLTYKAALYEEGKRVVTLSGEAYFEVAKDRQHPFIVKTGRQQVEVLGTHFNLSSYPDDATEKTTLLEGSVSVSASGSSKILKPGQQSRLFEGKLSVSETDTDLAVAWKNNEFVFESETIDHVMKMVERWYNVEVIYVGEKTSERFSGGVSRFDNVSRVLQIIESTGASHFKIQGRKIYVSK